MTPDKILEILKFDPALFNARYYKDAESAARHINQHYDEKTTPDEVKTVMAPLAIHAGTGEILPPM